MWADEDMLTILCSRKGKLGIVMHHLAWDQTICQVGHPYATPNDVKAARAYGSAVGCWLFMKAARNSTCDIFDAKGALINQIEGVGNEGQWMADFNNKSVVGRALFSPGTKSIVRISVDNSGGLTMCEFPAEGKLTEGKVVVADNRLFVVGKSRITRLEVE